MILTDTNILLRALYPAHPHYALAKRALRTLRRRGEILSVTPQIIIEFWAVATRAREYNGLGLQLAQVVEEVKDIRALFHLLPETVEIHSVSGILTFNVGDFRRFPGIDVLNPEEV